MSNLAYQTGFNQRCTYQHLIGDMLIKLNRLSEELKLTHSEYRVMASIIGLYNKTQGKAYPTIEYLTKVCCMAKSTVLKCLNALAAKGLLLITKHSGKRNNYFISNLAAGSDFSDQTLPRHGSPCKTAYNKTNRDRTNRIIIKNNDDDFNKSDNTGPLQLSAKHTPDNSEYKQVLEQLEKWSFVGAEFVIKKYGILRIKNLIELVKIKDPKNKGGYFRSLLNLPNLGGDNIPEINLPAVKTDSTGAINHVNEIKQINQPRLSKIEIINNLLLDQKFEEAQTLSKLWKIID